MFRVYPSRAVLGLALLLPPVASGGWGTLTVPQESGRYWQETLVPEKGVFLVASPNLRDPRFRRTVVLLLSHEQEGTLGLIVNRATDMPLSDLIPDLRKPSDDSNLLFLGGPVGLDGLLFLTRSGEPPERADHVMAEVYFSGDRDLLEELLRQGKDASQLRVYLGRSGWAPGQLAAEIAEGGWRLVRADAETLFEKDLDNMWRDLLPPPPRPFIVRHKRGPAGFSW